MHIAISDYFNPFRPTHSSTRASALPISPSVLSRTQNHPFDVQRLAIVQQENIPASIRTFSQPRMLFTFFILFFCLAAHFSSTCRPRGNGGAVLTALRCNCGGFKKQERAAIDRIFWSLICTTTSVSDPAPTPWCASLRVGLNYPRVNFRAVGYCLGIRWEGFFVWKSARL